MTIVPFAGINSARMAKICSKAIVRPTKSIGYAKNALMISKKCLDLKSNKLSKYYEAAYIAASFCSSTLMVFQKFDLSKITNTFYHYEILIFATVIL